MQEGSAQTEPMPARRTSRLPHAAGTAAFAVVLIALLVILLTTEFLSSGGWLGVLWGVASLLFVFLVLAAVYLVASLFTRTGRFAPRPSAGTVVGSDEKPPLGMTRRGLAWGALLLGMSLLYMGAGGIGAILGGSLLAVLPSSVALVVFAVVGAALIVASALILWRAPPNR